MEKKFPEGKYMSTVKLGAKGQIVIPKEVRELFGFREGESLILMADRERGIAIQPFSYAEQFWNAVNSVHKEKE